MYWRCSGCHFGEYGFFVALMSVLVGLVFWIHEVAWLQVWHFDLLFFVEVGLRLEKCRLMFVCYSGVVDVISFHL